jgi:hypothetical protein
VAIGYLIFVQILYFTIMKKIITLTILLFLTTLLFAQKSSYTIYIGKIKQTNQGRPKYEPITDTVKITDATKAQKLYKLIQAIIKNGTEDISKCFIPRDAVLIYTNNKLTTTALICFECDGIRIKGLETTTIKSVSKREKKMKELSVLMN